MKAVAAVILAGAVAVLGTLGARGDWPAEASAGGIVEAAEANGDVAPAVRAALVQVRDEDRAPAWVDVAPNRDSAASSSRSSRPGRICAAAGSPATMSEVFTVLQSRHQAIRAGTW